jgi:hypothetical protein
VYVRVLPDAAIPAGTTVPLPVYPNEARRDLLVSIDLQCPPDTPAHVWHQRGAALIMWSQP